MSCKFPFNNSARIAAFTELNDATSLSIVGRIRLDTLSASYNQVAIGHYPATAGWRVYRLMVTNQWKFGLSTNGTWKIIADPTITPAVGQVYAFAVTWLAGDSAGLKLYSQGEYRASLSTVGQSSYGPCSSDLYFGAYAPGTEYLEGTIETIAIWKNYILSAAEIERIYYTGWPESANRGPNWMWYFFERPGSGYVIPDHATGARPISTWTGTSHSLEPHLGRYDIPVITLAGHYHRVAGSSGPPAPNPWILGATVAHPNTVGYISGLTNNTTYEVQITAVDKSSNESTPSDILEATPVAPPANRHIQRLAIFGRK